MSVRNFLAAVFLSVVSLSALAFMPAPGLWIVSSEANGNPGRGFNIEVENEIVVFTYYGYRPDGSGAFYLAAGAIANNVFTGSLQEYAGGRYLGGPAVNAHATTSPGNVTITFSSGMDGTMNLPGEGPALISKFEFGYDNSPKSLLGWWLMMTPTSGGLLGDYKNMTTLVGVYTLNGNGVVTNTLANFTCEHQVSGVLAGDTVCAEAPVVTGQTNLYVFRMAGDRGSGYGMTYGLTTINETFVLRTTTASGVETSITDGLPGQIQAAALHGSRNLSADRTLSLAEPANVMPQEKITAINAWASEVGSLLHKQQ